PLHYKIMSWHGAYISITARLIRRNKINGVRGVGLKQLGMIQYLVGIGYIMLLLALQAQFHGHSSYFHGGTRPHHYKVVQHIIGILEDHFYLAVFFHLNLLEVESRPRWTPSVVISWLNPNIDCPQPDVHY